MSSVPERSEIDAEYRWDLEAMFADDDEWEAAVERARDLIEDLRAYEGRATDDAATLRETLETYEDLGRTIEDVVSYARMRRDEDTRRDRYQAMTARAKSLAADAASAGSFLEPEIQSLSREAFDAMVEDEPALATYEHYVDDVLRLEAHTRSAEVEGVISELGEVVGAGGEVYNLLTNADMTFPTVEAPDGEAREITLNNFTTLQKHRDRAFRREVYEAFYDEWATVRNAVGAALRNSVTTDVKLAETRDYDNSRAAALDGPNVPPAVYDALVETVEDELDVLHRHAELKNDVTDGETLRPYDFYVPVATGESPTVEYEQAREWVTEAVAPLGEAYQERVAEGFDSRWVDVYETRGKQSGAYSGGTYDSQPYVLMNYQDDVESLYTLAHELGHSIHSQLASERQPYVYADYDIFVAEVASTVNETLLTKHLLETVEDDRLRRHVLDQFAERFRSTLFRQTMFASFEQDVHALVEADEGLTPDRLDDIYREYVADYYAPAELDDRIAREWMRIPHFHRGFYVYQYATGISAAVAIVDRIEADGESAAADYREALAMGGSAYPDEVLATAGVDVTEPAFVRSAIRQYEATLDDLAALI